MQCSGALSQEVYCEVARTQYGQSGDSYLFLRLYLEMLQVISEPYG